MLLKEEDYTHKEEEEVEVTFYVYFVCSQVTLVLVLLNRNLPFSGDGNKAVPLLQLLFLYMSITAIVSLCLSSICSSSLFLFVPREGYAA